MSSFPQHRFHGRRDRGRHQDATSIIPTKQGNSTNANTSGPTSYYCNCGYSFGPDDTIAYIEDHLHRCPRAQARDMTSVRHILLTPGEAGLRGYSSTTPARTPIGPRPIFTTPIPAPNTFYRGNEPVTCKFCDVTMTGDELFTQKHYAVCRSKRAYEEAKYVLRATECPGCGQFFVRTTFLTHLKSRGNEECWKEWKIEVASAAAVEEIQAIKDQSQRVAVGTPEMVTAGRTDGNDSRLAKPKVKVNLPRVEKDEEVDSGAAASKEANQMPPKLDAEELRRYSLLPPQLATDTPTSQVQVHAPPPMGPQAGAATTPAPVPDPMLAPTRTAIDKWSELVNCRYCDKTMTRFQLFREKHCHTCESKEAYEKAEEVEGATKCPHCQQFFANKDFLTHLKSKGNEACWNSWKVKVAGHGGKNDAQMFGQAKTPVTVGIHFAKKGSPSTKGDDTAVEVRPRAVTEKEHPVNKGTRGTEKEDRKASRFDAKEVRRLQLLPPQLSKPHKK